ncbi:DNA polymerase III subunit alpha [Pseudocnuella soli]|uniref:DNA polymerase III subunit alpha n=1 Tax=Pseudocnuella soli TaxID=2502779 RepID=UPI00104B5FA4|nr:DNA polymerase III subunit alpha [Pseudocnuella soli]
MKYSHLHVHTQFSLLDGAANIQALYKKAIKENMPAIAITDHGNMFGAFEFVSEAYKHKNDDGSVKVKPVVGCEFYVVEDRTRKTFSKEQKDNRYHQVLLAKNAVGYQNLIKLTSLGYLEGMYSKYPRIDKGLIEQYSEGLIATTCCIGAYVPQTILHHGEEAAEKEFKWWFDMFGEDYFIELQRHNMQEQETINQVLLKFSKKYGVPVIATNDSHYTDRDDYNAHDILLCINTGEKQSTPGFDDFVNDDAGSKNRRFKFPNDQFYFKGVDEMKKLFSDIPEAIDNTNMIVDRVELLNLKKDILLPAFPIPKEFQVHGDSNLNQWEFLRHLTFEGAHARYGSIDAKTQERLDFELHTIKTMGFAGYFLIVSDFIKAGRDLGVFVGPGRGSAAGSAVAYCIGITNIDPIKYDLLFERFLNPDRKSMPDIDTDFDDEGRQKVIDYVVQKYGKNQVAQIVTYGTMAAKMSIKDVARVLDLPLVESNMLAKLVPDKPGTELGRVLHAPLTAKEGEKSLEEKEGYGSDDIENVKQLRAIYNGNDIRAQVLHEAERLEGSVRNTGIHAAGIIIAPDSLLNIIPVCTAKDSDLLVTQIEGKIIEDAGVIKMDFLGLKTLTIIKNALEMIKANHGVDIVIDDVPLDDEATYALYQKGETIATFQFESPGMQKYLKELKPDQFADLIAMNALYRPGPMAYIPQYVDRKHGREEVKYDLEEMAEYLEETYGITVYQEQVMLLAQKIGGFSKGDADVLRKAMGKKDRKTLDKMKSKFIDGAVAKGHEPKTLEKVWTDWEAFAQYAFNKSHSTCYAFVAYQTAYLKAHYPAEYMAAVLNNANAIEKLTFFMEECKRMGIKVLGPDINESQQGFAVNSKGEIRFGLGGLKGVGEAAVESIIAERKAGGPFKDPYDFIKRINQRTANKKTLENLIYAGAFDQFSLHRAQYFCVPQGEQINGLEKLVKYGNQVQSEANSAANTLFGDMSSEMDIKPPVIPPCEPWSLTEQLEKEKEVAGIYLSGHPLDHYRFEYRHYGFTTVADFNEIKDNQQMMAMGRTYRILCLVTSAQHRISRQGNKFGSYVLEDYTGKTELVLFGDDFIKHQAYLELGSTLLITGAFKTRYKPGEFEFKVSSVMLAENIKKALTKQVHLELEARHLQPQTLEFLDDQMKQHPGNTGLKISLVEGRENLRVNLSTIGGGLEMNYDFIQFLETAPEIGVRVETA